MRRALAALIAVVALVLVLYSVVSARALSWDLTEEGSATLSDQTRRVLDQLDRRIAITAFYPRDAIGRVEAATLLARYRRTNRKITYRVLDPRLAPGEAQRFGISDTGSAAVQDLAHPDKVEIAQYTIEIDVTSAIARSIRNVHATVCFTTGNGEREVADETVTGLSSAAGLLRQHGYRTRELDLLTHANELKRCDAVVMSSPTSEPSKGVAKRLRGYLDGGGKAWFFNEPGYGVTLGAETKPWGLRFLSGVIFEADPDSHLPDDLSAPIVRRYAGGSSVVRGLGPTFYPRAQGVEVIKTHDPGLTVTELAATSRLGYLDRAHVAKFDPKVDVEGPIAIGASADASEVQHRGTSAARIKRTRVLAWAEADCISNGYLQAGSNGQLLVQGIDWLTQPEDLVTAVPNFPKLRSLALTQARSRYILFLMAGVVPGLFAIAGGFVWAIRRGR
jgi:hypothetical protein